MASDYSVIELQTHHSYPMPGNFEEEPDYYIYFYHTGLTIILPTYPDLISDSLQVNYSSELPLGRSAPLLSYGGSGPRSILFSFILHRDIMWQLNLETNSSIEATIDDDYVDQMARLIQSAALPEYAVADKMISPPMVAVKIGTEVFIKGVVTGSVGVVYKPPVLKNGKYAQIDISFSVTEVVPYSATLAGKLGSYRNMGYNLMTDQVYVISTISNNIPAGTTITHGALAGNSY